MSYSDRNTDMGTAKEHVEALLTYWHEGLHTLVARTENAGEEQRKTIDYKESVEKLSTLRKTVRLLTEYAKNISDVSVGSRYEHLCSVYDTWGCSLGYGGGAEQPHQQASGTGLQERTRLTLQLHDCGHAILRPAETGERRG